ncbi:universal stress protein [Halalkalicoccus tibetensis]|uniref:Universal stress protein n=1 Tax=Halalkalicoccus tibetensis TaxID=175632 RepID=A0ABD5VBV9_9EURY
MAYEAGIRVGVRTRSLSEARLSYIRQLGATDVFIDHADTDEEPDEFIDRSKEITVEVVHNAIPSVSELKSAQKQVEVDSVFGDIPDIILTEANKRNCDHIFVTGEKRSPTGKAVFGDTAQSIILNFEGPVTVQVDRF